MSDIVRQLCYGLDILPVAVITGTVDIESLGPVSSITISSALTILGDALRGGGGILGTFLAVRPVELPGC